MLRIISQLSLTPVFFFFFLLPFLPSATTVHTNSISGCHDVKLRRFIIHSSPLYTGTNNITLLRLLFYIIPAASNTFPLALASRGHWTARSSMSFFVCFSFPIYLQCRGNDEGKGKELGHCISHWSPQQRHFTDHIQITSFIFFISFPFWLYLLRRLLLCCTREKWEWMMGYRGALQYLGQSAIPQHPA